MGFSVETLRQDINRPGDYIAPERICITKDNKICPAGDVLSDRLLVGKGQALPRALAIEYGLIGIVPPGPEVEAWAEPQEAETANFQAPVATPEPAPVVTVGTPPAAKPTKSTKAAQKALI